MRKAYVASAAVLCALLAPLIMAADHLDGPAASADPAADITDLFAWMSADAKTVYIIMNVAPLATASTRFSTAVQYVVHTTSRASFGAASSSSVNIICTIGGFGGADQKISCWAGNEFVTGNSGILNGIASPSGKLKVYAGVRDDPFFFNLDGFKNAEKTTIAVKRNLSFDDAGCPSLPPGNIVAQQLATAPDGGVARDFFKGLNVASIVLAVDKTILTTGGPILGVWASTNKP